MKNKVLIVTMTVIILCLTVTGCYYDYSDFFTMSTASPTPTSTTIDNTVATATPSPVPFHETKTVTVYTTTTSPVSATDSLADVVDKIQDSVVEINCTLPNGEAAGSGVIYGNDGDCTVYILTNNHVIENATDIKVILHNGTKYDAVLLATDSQGDVAVITIAPNEGETVGSFTYASLPDEKYAARVGDQVIVIGNPLGALGGTVTTGIVSALDRFITVEDTLMLLMQTDASINSGNSGGGIFNRAGQLIGLVNAKAIGDSVEGLGFAIPLATVKEISEQLIENGKVSRGAVGITVAFLPDENAKSSFLAQFYTIDMWRRITYSDREAYDFWYELFLDSRIDDYKYGVFVTEVSSTDEHTRACLQKGDYLISVNGERVTESTSLQKTLFHKNAGEVVSVCVYHADGTTQTYDITLVEK